MGPLTIPLHLRLSPPRQAPTRATLVPVSTNAGSLLSPPRVHATFPRRPAFRVGQTAHAASNVGVDIPVRRKTARIPGPDFSIRPCETILLTLLTLLTHPALPLQSRRTEKCRALPALASQPRFCSPRGPAQRQTPVSGSAPHPSQISMQGVRRAGVDPPARVKRRVGGA